MKTYLKGSHEIAAGLGGVLGVDPHPRVRGLQPQGHLSVTSAYPDGVAVLDQPLVMLLLLLLLVEAVPVSLVTLTLERVTSGGERPERAEGLRGRDLDRGRALLDRVLLPAVGGVELGGR